MRSRRCHLTLFKQKDGKKKPVHYELWQKDTSTKLRIFSCGVFYYHSWFGRNGMRRVLRRRRRHHNEVCESNSSKTVWSRCLPEHSLHSDRKCCHKLLPVGSSPPFCKIQQGQLAQQRLNKNQQNLYRGFVLGMTLNCPILPCMCP